MKDLKKLGIKVIKKKNNSATISGTEIHPWPYADGPGTIPIVVELLQLLLLLDSNLMVV